MFNRVILVGALTRDIELRYSSSGMGIAKTAIATNRKFTKDGTKHEEVCFVDITFFGRSAEVANQYLRKGSKILVEGRLSFEQWVDKDGGKRSKHAVVVETMQMLDTKASNDAPQAQQGRQEPRSQPSGARSPNPAHGHQSANPSYGHQGAMPEYDIDSDSIPF